MPEVAHLCPQQTPSTQLAAGPSSHCCLFLGLFPEWFLSPIEGVRHFLLPFLLGHITRGLAGSPCLDSAQTELGLSLGLPPTFISELLHHCHMSFLTEPSLNPQIHLVALSVSMEGTGTHSDYLQ